MKYTVEPIAHIYNDYVDKFGIPRQSGLESTSVSEIVFEKKYRDENALRGLSEYSHIWLLWIFSQAENDGKWSATVRPPRLGGNKRMGVFSTRSPYHPNRIGLSCVKLLSIEKAKDKGCILRVEGADLMNGTPIIDIKPYLAFTDAHSDAICGFADGVFDKGLSVEFATEYGDLPSDLLENLKNILSQDPRPSYQNDEDRIYSMNYSCYEIKFRVSRGVLTVTHITKQNGCEE